jgi:hypothetical protein
MQKISMINKNIVNLEELIKELKKIPNKNLKVCKHY